MQDEAAASTLYVNHVNFLVFLFDEEFVARQLEATGSLTGVHGYEARMLALGSRLVPRAVRLEACALRNCGVQQPLVCY